MLDSIYIGLTGLTGYSRGLKVISNNVANMNTPGFKASQLQFADLFYAGDTSGSGSEPAGSGIGVGVNTLSTRLNFSAGDFQQTGNNLDLAITGDGFFVVKDDGGNLSYTRAGQFDFDKNGILIDTTNGSKVMGLDSGGKLTEISIADLHNNAPKVSSTLSFTGNLSSDGTTQVVDGLQVFDAVGGTHTLTATFTNQAPTTPGSWTVTVTDGATTVATGTIAFLNGSPDPAHSTLSFTYSPSGVPPIPLTLDFSQKTTSFAAGTTSTLAFDTQDGFAAGVLSSVAVDAQGRLKLTYSNGQTTNDQEIALAHFDSNDSLESAGGNLFRNTDSTAVKYGAPGSGELGTINAGGLELSNVNLSSEFGNLIVTERGYQSSSQVISTANDMIQQLLDMKSHRG